MLSPNLFLKLNISFNLIIGLSIIYFNFCKNNCLTMTNFAGLLFIYISINNTIILRQKSAPKLKKDILQINTLLYIIIGLFLLISLHKTKLLNKNTLIMLVLNFFILLLNYTGYKITKV